MTEILFYHLKNTPLEQTLPLLVARSHQRGWRVIIRGGSEERLRALDDLLWTFDEESFLPHGMATDANAEKQPILLTLADERPNAADVLFLIDSSPLPAQWPYQRVVVMFSEGDQESKDLAREQWKEIKAMPEHQATYWLQDDAGRWVKRA